MAALDEGRAAVRLRHARPSLGIVLMTGFTTKLEIAMADGFTVVPKPFDPVRLAALIEHECRAAEVRRPAPAPAAS